MPAHLSADMLSEIVETQGAIATAGLAIDDVLAIVAERSRRIAGADAAVVELPEGDEMVYRAATGDAARYLGLRLPIASSLSGRCLTSGEVQLCDDAESDPRVDADACRKVGVRSMIVVPLVHRARTVGVLKVMSRAPAKFSEATGVVLAVMAGLIAAALRNAELDEEVHRLSAQHERVALTDSLTGLANRRAGQDALIRGAARARRTRSPMALIVFDIDRFKAINDARGQGGGDAVLRAVAEAIRSTARAADLAVRWGGEEFVLLLDDTGLDGAVRCAERVRARIEAAAGVTVSAGVAELADGEGPEYALARADEKLYDAKTAGRNRVCF